MEEWVSIGDLARAKGLSVPAISKRVSKLKLKGLKTKKGDGGRVLVHRALFDALATNAPAQDFRNRRQREAVARRAAEADGVVIAEPPAQLALSYDEAAAKRLNAQAELAEITLAKERRELIPVGEIARASIDIATVIAQRISSIQSKAGELYAASVNGGEEGLSAKLADVIRAAQEDIGAAMTRLSEVTTPPGNA